MSLDLANTCTKSRELTRYLWIKEEKEAGASEKLPSSSFGWSKQEFNGPSSWRSDEIVVTWAGVQVTLFCPPVRLLMCCRQRLALGKECTKLIPGDVSHGEDSEASARSHPPLGFRCGPVEGSSRSGCKRGAVRGGDGQAGSSVFLWHPYGTSDSRHGKFAKLHRIPWVISPGGIWVKKITLTEELTWVIILATFVFLKVILTLVHRQF